MLLWGGGCAVDELIVFFDDCDLVAGWALDHFVSACDSYLARFVGYCDVLTICVCRCLVER